jgi:phosphonate transport system ATP-binding protein
LREGKIIYRGSKEEIRAMTDEQFKTIYGEEAVRIGEESLGGGTR